MNRFFLLLMCISWLASSLEAGDHTRKFEKPRFKKDKVSAGAPLSIQTGAVPEKQTKSKKKAFFYSLLLPGMGELYLNDWKFSAWGSGMYYFTAEALLWSGSFYLRSYGGWLKDDARALAARNAGVDLSSAKPSNYYFNIGKFSDIYSYNDHQRRYVGTETLYSETEANFWQWNSEKNRRRYDRMRIDSDNYRNISQYILWGVFVNHVMSAVNSMRLFRQNHSLSGLGLNLTVAPDVRKPGFLEVRGGVAVKF